MTKTLKNKNLETQILNRVGLNRSSHLLNKLDVPNPYPTRLLNGSENPNPRPLRVNPTRPTLTSINLAGYCACTQA